MTHMKKIVVKVSTDNLKLNKERKKYKRTSKYSGAWTPKGKV